MSSGFVFDRLNIIAFMANKINTLTIRSKFTEEDHNKLTEILDTLIHFQYMYSPEKENNNG